jgi:hypothetical protein
MSKSRFPEIHRAKRRSNRPSASRARRTVRNTAARAVAHPLRTARRIADVARLTFLVCRLRTMASFLQSSFVRAKSILPRDLIGGPERSLDVVSGRRSSGHDRRGTGGASEDEIRSSTEDSSSARSSHHGTVSSVHGGIGADSRDWDLRAPRPLDPLGRQTLLLSRFAPIGPSSAECTACSAMRSTVAPGQTISTAESGTTRERRPLRRRNVPSRPVSSRLTRPRDRPSQRTT